MMAEIGVRGVEYRHRDGEGCAVSWALALCLQAAVHFSHRQCAAVKAEAVSVDFRAEAVVENAV